MSRICVCPVCINALSDCVIVYSGFCGCIFFLLRVLVLFFFYFLLLFISHYFSHGYSRVTLFIFSFCVFCFSFFVLFLSLTLLRFSRAISLFLSLLLSCTLSHSRTHTLALPVFHPLTLSPWCSTSCVSYFSFL